MNESTLRYYANQAFFDTPVWPDGRFPPSPYYRFFRVLAGAMKPNLSVELGVCGGGGSFHLAIGWEKGMVVGVESADGSQHERDNWEYIKQRCSNFVFWKGDSVEDAAEISNVYGLVDILFIDTTHTKEQTEKEWNAWEPFLSSRAIVILDDLFRPGMDEAWSNVPWPNKMRLDFLHDGSPGIGGGFGVVWR